ncbi:diguanylate cyclase (GGDEF)-like protein [Comamonas odontotermitis]|uniref:Diguanylate cyclase (GGDEF)-like protein n=1 Tax=Comamonas odontotermitis TaxID=379895 RepID=A0ABR6RJ87_9BURK|nr:diguanylate cyclase [Comamonas odontotermitis]MBB6579199.1 diguanylate cyclase (GGDEF)-like protein [Comamonas odontotermitis]
MPTRKASSLTISLILPFVMLIALLTGVLGVLWYWTGSKTVSTLSQQLMVEMAERISQAVDRHIFSSRSIIEASFPDGMYAPGKLQDDMPALRTRLWAATSLTGNEGDYVYYGNQSGQGIGLLRKSETLAELRLKLRAEDYRAIYTVPGIKATPVLQSTETQLFDPRTRPWYRLAQSAKSHVWTPVYIDFNARDLVMTRARSVFAEDDRLAGVVATDVFLNNLRKFVDGLPLAKGASAFIMEPNGDLIAATRLDNIRYTDGARPSRVNAGASGNHLIEVAYEKLRSRFDESSEVAQTSLIFDPDGNAIEVAYRRITDDAGLNWLAVVAVPHQEMLAGIRSHVILVVALGLLALGTALGLGLRIFGGLAHDMRSLTHAVRRVGQGEIDAPIGVARNDEIGELASNVHHMRHRLFTDPLTGASNRSALLHILEALTRKGASGTLPASFAVLFMDLDKFKPLNDRWGHENGDLALMEVVQRIRSILRSNDMLARLGGDEFVVVLQGVETSEQASMVRDKILEVMDTPLTSLKGVPAQESVYLGASIGQAIYPADGSDAQTLLKHADRDMYRQKAQARSDVL